MCPLTLVLTGRFLSLTFYPTISFQVSKKLFGRYRLSPCSPPPIPSLLFHLQVIFASKKNPCLCSNMEAIFLICFAIPDEYLYLHLCYKAAGYCLKLNHKVIAFLLPTHTQIWDPPLTLSSSSSVLV